MSLSFNKYFYWSCSVHGLAFLAILLSPLLPTSKRYFSQEPIVWVNIPKGTAEQWGSPIKKSTALPQTTIQEQKKALESPPVGVPNPPQMTYTPPMVKEVPRLPTPEKIEPQKKIPPVKEVPKTVTPPRRTGHPMSRIDQALARIQKEVATKKAEPEAGQVPDAPAGGFSVGNTTGQYVPPNDPEYVLYQMKIRQRIMNQWIVPLKFTEEAMGLVCRIVVHINDQGDVVQKEWERRSGNDAYDLSAMRAIERASPLDIPPDRLKFEVLNEGFAVEFRPQAAAQTTP